MRRSDDCTTLTSLGLWLGPTDEAWHSRLGVKITAMADKGNHPRSEEQVQKLYNKQMLLVSYRERAENACHIG